MTLTVVGAGAFGTALAIALSRDDTEITLWARDVDLAQSMQADRQNSYRLPNRRFPEAMTVTSNISAFDSEFCLLAVPMQALASFLSENPALNGQTLIACCKGVDQKTGLGPVATIAKHCPASKAALLTGPSFAVDIAAGLPTALVMASADDAVARNLQDLLTRPALRLYRSNDVIGAELGGALKNVIALAAGIAIGAGLGDSARASVIARGFAELSRFALAKGAKLETLQGLSGLGDLVLTCTSEKSRNFAAGIALGNGNTPDPSSTIEGIATANALASPDLPIVQAVAAVTQRKLDIETAVQTLMSRPVGKE